MMCTCLGSGSRKSLLRSSHFFAAPWHLLAALVAFGGAALVAFSCERSHAGPLQASSWRMPRICPLTEVAWTMLAVLRRRRRRQDQLESFLTCFLSDVQQLSLRDAGAPQFFVKMRDAEPIALMYSPDDSIDDIKAAIRNKKGIPPVQQVLSYGGQQLEAGYWLVDYNIQEGQTVKLKVRTMEEVELDEAMKKHS